MFCPKCGQQNPDNGRFCRNCGKDLGNVSSTLDTVTATLPKKAKKDREPTIDGAMRPIFTGIAFIIVAIILTVTNVAGGKFWGFWLLIPGFGTLGSGIAAYLKYRRLQEEKNFKALDPIPDVTFAPRELPLASNNYIPNSTESYKTGDLVPPSVTDSTTRHLDINKEGQTMTLPKEKEL